MSTLLSMADALGALSVALFFWFITGLLVSAAMHLLTSGANDEEKP